MCVVKIFRVRGRIHKPNYQTAFSKDVRALKPEDAIEGVYTKLGGQHKVKRVHLKVDSVEEVSWKTTNDPIIKALSRG